MNEINVNGKILCVFLNSFSSLLPDQLSVVSFDFESRELSFQFHFLVPGPQLKM